MKPLISAVVYLGNVLVLSYLYILTARLWMQKFRANAFNPFSQFVMKLSDPLVKPLRKVFPGFKGFDLSIVALILLLQWLLFYLLFLLSNEAPPNLLASVIVSIGQVCMLMVNFFFFVVIVSALLSWLPQLQNAPISQLVSLLARPLLSRARRFIPLVAGFDLSPIAVLIFLQLLNILLFGPIVQFGASLLTRV